MTSQPLTLEEWHQFIRDSGADPIFHRFPSALIQQLRDGVPLPRPLAPYFRVVRKGAWKNEMILMLACYFLEQIGKYRKEDRTSIFESTYLILRFASKKCGKKDLVKAHYHLAFCNIIKGVPEELVDEYSFHYNQFLESLQFVERIFPNLPFKEREDLLKFKVDLPSSLAHSHVTEYPLEHLCSLLPNHIKSLDRATLDKMRLESTPGDETFSFLITMLDNLNPKEIPALVAFTLLCKVRGEPQEHTLTTLSDYDSASLENFPDQLTGKALDFNHLPSPEIFTPSVLFAIQSIRKILTSYSDTSYLADSLALKPPTAETEKSKTGMMGTWHDIFPDQSSRKIREMCQELLPSIGGEDEPTPGLNKVLNLLNKFKSSSWHEYFVVSTVCMTVNRGHRPTTLLSYLRYLRKLLDTIPEQDLLIGSDVLQALEAELSDGEGANRRKNYLIAYLAACQARETLVIQYPKYKTVLLNYSLPDLPKRPTLPRSDTAEQARRADARRDSIDQIAEHWHLLHQQADRRYIALRSVMLAVRQVIGDRSPARFTEPAPLSVPIPGTQATWHFTIWTRSTFHHHVWGQPMPPVHQDQFFLEYRESAGEPDFWAADICRAWVSEHAAEQFEQTWRHPISQLKSPAAGVLGNERNLNSFLRSACAALTEQRRDLPCVFDHESLYRGVLFGALALRIGRYGGHRGHELLQLKTNDDDLLVRLHRGQELLLMRFYPKGRKGTRFNPAEASYKVVTSDALRVIEAVEANRLYTQEEHESSHGDTDAARAGHVFRIKGRVLSVPTINACMRFLLHGLLPPDEEAEVVLVRTHLMRYGFAVHAKANGVHISDLAVVMNHRNPAVTERYGRATQRQTLQTLTSVAVQSGMWSSSAPSENAPESVLTIPGGQCTYLAECHDTRSCVGCAFKRPEPAARAETEHVVQSLTEQVAHARGAGWQDTRRLTKQLQHAQKELNTMDIQQTFDQIETILDQQEQQILRMLRRRFW